VLDKARRTAEAGVGKVKADASAAKKKELQRLLNLELQAAREAAEKAAEKAFWQKHGVQGLEAAGKAAGEKAGSAYTAAILDKARTPAAEAGKAAAAEITAEAALKPKKDPNWARKVLLAGTVAATGA